MASKPEEKHPVHEIAGGWISEYKGTPVPSFLKLAYVGIAIGTVSYLVLYMNGETGHPDRGSLVEQFNRATEASPGLMYGIAALTAAFFLAMILFALRSNPEE